MDAFSAAGLRVQTPFGPRKSGMPESVEMPAPVSTTMRVAASTQSRASATDVIGVFSPISRFSCVPKSLIGFAAASTLIVGNVSERIVAAGYVAPATLVVVADPITFTTPIEPKGLYDPRVDKGTVEQVCFAYGRTDDDVRQARLLPGAQAASAFMRTVFLWAGRGTLGQCREILTSTTNRNCDGQIYPTLGPGPDLPLHFYSDCWSNHAQGRASDFLVGTGSGRTRIRRGTALIEWLLAPDANGNTQARARRLGVQEILFFDRCWESNEPDDLDTTTWDELDECDVGHYDHVHLSFTIAGALGLTSGYGPATVDCPGCPLDIRPRK